MVGNLCFDREQGRLVYNIEDPEHRLLTVGADVGLNFLSVYDDDGSTYDVRQQGWQLGLTRAF